MILCILKNCMVLRMSTLRPDRLRLCHLCFMNLRNFVGWSSRSNSVLIRGNIGTEIIHVCELNVFLI
jgi:hypothetical protein